MPRRPQRPRRTQALAPREAFTRYIERRKPHGTRPRVIVFRGPGETAQPDDVTAPYDPHDPRADAAYLIDRMLDVAFLIGCILTAGLLYLFVAHGKPMRQNDRH